MSFISEYRMDDDIASEFWTLNSFCKDGCRVQKRFFDDPYSVDIGIPLPISKRPFFRSQDFVRKELGTFIDPIPYKDDGTIEHVSI
jgi:hypothetical protein